MVTTAATLEPKRSVLGRRAGALLLGAACVGLMAGALKAEPAMANAAQGQPAGLTAPRAAEARDFATGAVAPAAPAPNATAPATERAEPAAPAAPALPAPGVAATPAPVDLAPLPAAIVALLAETGPTAQLKLPASDRQALSAFYAARQGAPLWIEGSSFSAKATAAKARVAKAGDDALDPKAFKLPGDPAANAGPADLARADVQLSAAALLYARQAWGGRITPVSLSPLITAEPTPFDAQAALASLTDSHDVAATLDGFNPQHPQFQELRKLLAEARAARGAAGEQPEQPRIAFGKLLEPGAEDPRVPTLRKRLGLTGQADDLYYDSVLADAVITFQKKNNIGASGLVNRTTIRALNAGSHPKSDADLIEVNMERWRWLPRDLGAKHVFVDIPVFRLHIMQDGRSTYDTRVIVGKPANQTPVFSDQIDHIVVNPYWNVPSTIALNEMQGSSLRGFEVVDNRGRKVTDFSWEDVKANRVRIRQPPGERNALGHIKFMFPNKHSVYLHDTSSRKLFEKSARALSHGCVRVDKPLEFADALSGDQGLPGSKLKAMIGGNERRLNLSTPISVHLTYFTAWVGADGKLEARDDLYSHDSRLRAALRGEKLPPLPVDPAPRVIAKAKPKPKPADAVATAPGSPRAPGVVADAAPPMQRNSPDGPGAWLARIFGPR